MDALVFYLFHYVVNYPAVDDVKRLAQYNGRTQVLNNLQMWFPFLNITLTCQPQSSQESTDEVLFLKHNINVAAPSSKNLQMRFHFLDITLTWQLPTSQESTDEVSFLRNNIKPT
jgi:hypothetical protein